MSVQILCILLTDRYVGLERMLYFSTEKHILPRAARERRERQHHGLGFVLVISYLSVNDGQTHPS
jgi:hypothetical protein